MIKYSYDISIFDYQLKSNSLVINILLDHFSHFCVGSIVGSW